MHEPNQSSIDIVGAEQACWRLKLKAVISIYARVLGVRQSAHRLRKLLRPRNFDKLMTLIDLRAKTSKKNVSSIVLL